MSSLDKIRNFIKEELETHDKEDQWDFHLKLVKKYADKLASIYKDADDEVVELAVWLHDITRIESLSKNHNVTGAAKAENLLREMNYPQDIVEKVKHCILTHRCKDGDPKPESIEAKILASADGMAHFDIIPLLMWMAGKHTDMDIREAARWLYHKIERAWEKKIILPEAREMVKDKYRAFQVLFRDVI